MAYQFFWTIWVSQSVSSGQYLRNTSSFFLIQILYQWHINFFWPKAILWSFKSFWGAIPWVLRVGLPRGGFLPGQAAPRSMGHPPLRITSGFHSRLKYLMPVADAISNILFFSFAVFFNSFQQILILHQVQFSVYDCPRRKHNIGKHAITNKITAKRRKVQKRWTEVTPQGKNLYARGTGKRHIYARTAWAADKGE